MSNLEEQITREKQRYLEFAERNRDKHIYIYGAGKQAVPIADFFEKNDFQSDFYIIFNTVFNLNQRLF